MLKVGDVYREYDNSDYGDIARWKVTQSNERVAVVQNQATLKEVAVTKESLDTFTWQCYKEE